MGMSSDGHGAEVMQRASDMRGAWGVAIAIIGVLFAVGTVVLLIDPGQLGTDDNTGLPYTRGTAAGGLVLMALLSVGMIGLGTSIAVRVYRGLGNRRHHDR